MATLRSWLRREPQPARLRIRNVDDEERIVELSPDTRNRWKSAEEAVLAARAVLVECIDDKGSILRAQKLEVADSELGADDGGGYDADRQRVEKALSKERREIAGIIEQVTRGCNTSFARGAEAASVSQDNLVTLVTTLTGSLTGAITNMHNMAISLANAITDTAGGNEEGGRPDPLALLGQLIAARAGSAVAPPAAAATPKNGKATNG